MTLGKKIGLCVSSIVLLCSILGAVGWASINALGGHLDEALGSTARKIKLTGEVRASVLTFRLQERGLLLFSTNNSTDQVAKCQSAYDLAMSQALANVGEIRSILETDGGRRAIDAAEAGILEYKQRQIGVRNLLAAGKVSEATEFDRENLVTAGARIVAALDQFDGLLRDFNVAAANRAEATRRNARLVFALGLLACIPIVCIVVFVLTRTTRELRRVADHLRETASQMTSAASQVASSSQSLALGASEQAASLEETSASSEEINSMAHRNTDSSRSAAALMTESQEKFVQTRQSLEEMETAMGEIKSTTARVSKIIKVIDEISFQTNILALNAAVEAARAGEAGSGFAVVADEVRNLAQRCALAAKDTAALIEESITKSDVGMTKVDHVTGSIRVVAEQSSKVKTLIDEVSMGSQEQARGIEQISKAVLQMQQLTQTSAANAQQGAEAGEQMGTQATTLNNAARRLREVVGSSAFQAFESRTAAPARTTATKVAPVFSSAKAPARSTAKAYTGRTSTPARPSSSNTEALAALAKAVPAKPMPVARMALPLDDDFKDF